MKRTVSRETRREILRAMGGRYRSGNRTEKAQILDQLVSITGYHRKHAIRVLDGKEVLNQPLTDRISRRTYNEAVREALILIWEAADRICGRRLKAVIPDYIESMERHGHIDLDPGVRELLLKVSPATVDRLLKTIRPKATGGRKKRRRPNELLKRQVPVRTYSDWNDEPAVFCEADFVAHNGGIISGACVHSLVATDVCSGWTEALALVTRQEGLVVEALEVLRAQLPFPLLGLDFDNEGTFMSVGVFGYCRDHGIMLTRSRVYRKNDQAWIEQKNGSVIRRLIGYGRYTGLVATNTMGHLYQLSRLYVNFFQPSFKLRSKTRQGAKVTKTYFPPATPCDRLLKSDQIPESIKESLREQRRALDPVRLLHGIRELQATLSALAKPPGFDHGPIPSYQSLDAFLAALPRLWEAGDPRPNHRSKPQSRHWWRTRKDPFEHVWPEVLGWLQNEPDAAAKDLFKQLQEVYPGLFPSGQLRTLQRRVREWRQAMARELIYAGTGNAEY